MQEVQDILNPTVFIGNFEFREPVTTLTDFLAGITAAMGYIILSKGQSVRGNEFLFYRNYFLFFAFGMTSAAWLGHGLQAYISSSWKMIGWICSLTAQSFLAFASINQASSQTGSFISKAVKVATLALYVVFVTLILYPQTRSFKLPQVGNAIILICVTVPFQVYYYLKTKNKGSLYIIYAVLFGGLTALAYNLQVSFSRWFNYHDLSHCMVCITLIFMILGAQKLAFKSSFQMQNNAES